jgi:hypothetical protein
MDNVSSDNRWPISDWVRQALKHADDMPQVELSRQMQARGLRTVDKSAVNKIVKGDRRLTADEMLAIHAITKFPLPGAQSPSPQPMGEATPKESVEKVELSRSAGQGIAESHLRRLMAKVFELMRPKGMTSVLADNLLQPSYQSAKGLPIRQAMSQTRPRFSNKRELSRCFSYRTVFIGARSALPPT